MRLDLETLRQQHPKLPDETASGYSQCAALALQRRHLPGVVAAVTADGEPTQATIHWTPRSDTDAEQKDAKRVTEDGAEALALALVKQLWGWTISRRLQQGEAADWLMVDETSHKVALEISGMDDGEVRGRMSGKLEQVQHCLVAPERAACVVCFRGPEVSLQHARGKQP